VERALWLWKDGWVTCENLARQQVGGSYAFVSTDRKSKETDFVIEKWGDVMVGYMKNIREQLLICPAKSDALVTKAESYAGLKERNDSGLSLIATDETVNERAFLVDDSDSDD
jgi:hypothetical protein